MDSLFKVSKKGLCGITVTGLELDNDEYLNEPIASIRNYTYEQSVTINILKSVNSKQEDTIEDVSISLHRVDCIDESTFTMTKDGMHQITHMILPTQDWFNYIMLHAPESLQAYYGVYFYDTIKNSFIKFDGNYLVEVPLQEILEINAVAPSNVTELTTTIIKNTKNTFCLCKLRDCFYKICRNLLEQYPVKCPDKSTDLNQYKYYRDILWMTINTIKYLLERQQFYEAQRMLEDVTYCGSICNNLSVTTKNSSNCGCSKN